jgi:hypothetical protein
MTDLSVTTRRELAHRSSDGIDVTLVQVADGRYGRYGEEHDVVCVLDRRDGAYFEIPAEPYLALDIYYHPFVYRDFSTVNYEQSPLPEATAEFSAHATQSGREHA